MQDLKSYFEFMGWKGSDTIFIGYSQGVNDNWSHYAVRLCTALLFLNDGVPSGRNYYYSCGAFRRGVRKRLKKNVLSMRELVLDIDFKAIDADFALAQTKADEMLKFFPAPTVLVNSGNGYHVHYRLDGSVDKHDYEAVYKRLVAWANSQYPGYIDPVWSCEHLFRLPFSNNCKDPNNIKPVRIIETNDIGYSLADLSAVVPSDFVCDTRNRNTLSNDTQKNEIKNICKREIKKSGIDRSEAIFGICLRVYELMPCVSDVTLISILKQFPELVDRYRNEQEMRKDIRRIYLKIASRGISSVMPIEKIYMAQEYDISYIDDKRDLFDTRVFDSRGENEKKFDIMLRLYSRMWYDRDSGIISVPCSSSKTFSALIYASIIADTLSQSNKKIWFVSEKISDCQRNADVLIKLGVNAIAYHGQPNTCTVPQKDFWLGKKPCKDCKKQCGAEIKYLHGLDYALSRCDILCCTHAFFAAKLAKDADINAELVIIDESPELLEQYELTLADITLIENHLSGSERLDDMFHHEIKTKIRDVLIDNGTHKIEAIDLSPYSDAIAKAWKAVSQGENDSVERLEAVLGFFRFFRSGSDIYGMKTGSCQYRFIAGQIDVSIPNSVVWVLDGSAKNQLTKWDGLKMYEVEELKNSFERTHIKLLQGNPTKTHLAKTKTRKELVSEAQNLSGKTILFSNKTIDGEAEKTVKEVEKTLTQNGSQVIHMCRGEHVGSNKGRSANANLICMSLFSDVADYALRASIYYGKEIAENEIFGTQKVNGKDYVYVKLNNGGFENNEMRDIATRRIQRDLYQAVMRGCIRDDANADYNVVAIVSDTDIIHALRDDLPGAKITIGDSDIIEMWLEGKTMAEIARELGKSRQSVEKAVKAFLEKIRRFS